MPADHAAGNDAPHRDGRLLTLPALGLAGGVGLCLISALLGAFGRWSALPLLLGVAWLGAAASIALARRLVPPMVDRIATRRALVGLLAVGLLAPGAWRCAAIPRSQPILGEEDQGIYLAAATAIARGGGPAIDLPLATADPRVTALVSPPLHPVALAGQPAEANPSPWIGFVLAADGSSATSHFPVGWPATLAAWIAVGDLDAAALANACLSTLAGLLLAAIAARHLGPVAGACGLAVAWTTPLLWWIAATSYAEPLVLVLLLAAWLAACAEERPGAGAVAAHLLCALAVACKLDALPAVAAAVLLVPLPRGRRPRVDLILRGALQALACGGILLLSSSYSGSSLLAAATTLAWPMGLGSAVVLVALVVLGGPRAAPLRSAAARRLPVALGLAVALAAFGLWWLRPLVDQGGSYWFWPLQREIPDLAHLTVPRLAWYMGAPALAAAFIGWALAIATARDRALLAPLLVGAAVLVLLGVNPMSNPLQPYVMRRLVPTVLPALILGLAAVAGLAATAGPWRRTRVAGIGLLVAWSALGGLERSATITGPGRYPGAGEAVAGILAAVPEGAILVTPRHSNLARLAPYLSAQGRSTLLLPSVDDPETWATCEALWDHLLASGRPVYALTSRVMESLSAQPAMDPVAHGQARLPYMPYRTDHLPTEARELQLTWALSAVAAPALP